MMERGTWMLWGLVAWYGMALALPLAAAPCYGRYMEKFITQPYWAGTIAREGDRHVLTAENKGGRWFAKVMSDAFGGRSDGFRNTEFRLSARVSGKGDFRIGVLAYPVPVNGKREIRQFWSEPLPLTAEEKEVSLPFAFGDVSLVELRVAVEVQGEQACARFANPVLDDCTAGGKKGSQDGPLAQVPDMLSFRTGRLSFGFDKLNGMTLCRVAFEGEVCDNGDYGAQYGSVARIRGAGGFVGAAHRETGFVEQVERFEVLADGRPIDLTNRRETIAGEVIVVRKRSRLRMFTVETEWIASDNSLSERYCWTTDADCRLESIYNGMHPWSTKFTTMLSIDEAGQASPFDFRGDDKMAFPGFRPFVAFYRPDTGMLIATKAFPAQGQHRLTRLIWDTTRYRKDYLMDFEYALFPGGRRAEYRIDTRFLRQKDPAQWQNDARQAMAQMK